MSTSSPQRRLLGRTAVGARYGGKNPRTIKRWKDAGLLPPPDAVVNNREYWFEDKLDTHDRQRAAEALSKPARTHQFPPSRDTTTT
jgi:hypothetical protein